MAMLTTAARIYIATVIGGSQSPGAIDAADEALRRGYSDWQIKRNWEFLLKDNTRSTAVTGCAATGAASSVTAPSAGAFDFVNVGQGVTISTGTATLTAGTVVSAITRGTDGVISSITLSNAFGGTTNSNATLTFSALMHITAGSNDYSMPNDMWEPYTGRFVTTSKRPVLYKNQRLWDRTQYDQTISGVPCEYTMYNPYSDLSQGHGARHLKFDVVPDRDDDLLLRYYRLFIVDGTYVDMVDQLLYPFLDYCRARALEAKRAQENPQGYLNEQKASQQDAAENDEEHEDNEDSVMRSQNEMGFFINKPIVGGGEFWP
jgi:hypothetical protein